ncbi:MAG: (2Fe-2S) ferredoxin domain-containing protein [Sandaracinaceae bacterium]|nr:(2Fe-2S) ferredoxin domain-containing protein [Sandaracinaceae bacterium]
MPKRQRYLWVCTNERPAEHPSGSCARSGSRELLATLKKAANARGLSESVRVCGSTCLDLCWVGNAVAVQPDNVFYGHVTEKDVPEIVEALVQGTLVERLLVPPELFDDPVGKKKS